MAGPKAPKDPTAKGSSFYICRQKDVAGNPVPDGRGIQFIYLNDVRLITFAQMVGNITDEQMLNNLKSADTFKNMVAGIGVTIESDERNQIIDFVFQMYGKTDPNNSGTTIRKTCVPDGMEQILWFDDFEWSEDDDLPGQMRFEFEKAGRFATVDVKLYLREGYTAPEQEDCNKIDVTSPDYQAMIQRSFMQSGNNYRIKQMLKKAKAGEDVTIAFIGGSITQGAGAIPIHTKCYAYRTWEKFMQTFGCDENVHFVKAGVGGTPSELGMIRFERDVLKDETIIPDLVVIEFAVNDEGDETKGLCYESLVRKALALSDKTAVLLLFAVFANDWNLQQRLGVVGERYELPMVSALDAVVPQFYQKPGAGRVLTKSQFFYDSYHPTNMGHEIMADCIMHMLKEIDKQDMNTEVSYFEKEPVFGIDFTNVKLLDKNSNLNKAIWLEPGSFCETDKNLQYVEMDKDFGGTPQFPYNWQHKKGDKPFGMKLCCKALLLVSKDSGEIDSAKVSVRVDGKEVLIADPREVGWTHCNAQILFSEKESKEHLIEISVLPGDEDKLFTILGFGYVE